MDPLTLTILLGGGALFLFANRPPKTGGGPQKLTTPNQYVPTDLSKALNGALGTVESQLGNIFSQWRKQQSTVSNSAGDFASSGQYPAPQDYADGGLKADGTPVLLALPSAGDGSSGTSGASNDGSTVFGGTPSTLDPAGVSGGWW